MTGIERAIKAAVHPDHKPGTQEALAALLGVTQPAVSRYVKQGYVPQSQVLAVNRLTGVPIPELVSPGLRRIMQGA